MLDQIWKMLWNYKTCSAFYEVNEFFYELFYESMSERKSLLTERNA